MSSTSQYEKNDAGHEKSQERCEQNLGNESTAENTRNMETRAYPPLCLTSLQMEASVDDLSPISSNPTQCGKCSQNFQSSGKLRRHQQAHSEEAQAVCTFCSSSIKYAYNLKTHLANCPEANKWLAVESLREMYPEFMAALKDFIEYRTSRLPKFEDFGIPFEMDKEGLVTANDSDLDISKNSMANEQPNKDHSKL